MEAKGKLPSGHRCIHLISSPVKVVFSPTADLLELIPSLKGERIMLLAVGS